jgi:hypothetical protein
MSPRIENHIFYALLAGAMPTHYRNMHRELCLRQLVRNYEAGPQAIQKTMGDKLPQQ